MRYFDRAAPAHHEDEERHVLPRLRALGLAALADRLHAEHAAMSAAWQALLPSLLLVADRQRPPSVNTLAAAWADFARLYAGHLAAEDELAFPAAMESLDAAVLQAIGAEMAARRGLR
jgi:hemerythrin-like domain-containing protein